MELTAVKTYANKKKARFRPPFFFIYYFVLHLPVVMAGCTSGTR